MTGTGEEITFGQIAYEAYREFSHGKSLISGAQLPTWDEQSPEICDAWQHAALKLCDHLVRLANKHVDNSVDDRVAVEKLGSATAALLSIALSVDDSPGVLIRSARSALDVIAARAVDGQDA